MKVKIEINEQLKEPYAVIFTEKITDEISNVAELLSSTSNTNFLVLEQDEKYVVVQIKDIYMVRFEDQRVVIYGQKEKFFSKLRLYEIEEQLGSIFMRISKTTLINLEHIQSVEPSFSGTMVLKLENGCKDYISRKYLPDFKRYLGI